MYEFFKENKIWNLGKETTLLLATVLKIGLIS